MVYCKNQKCTKMDCIRRLQYGPFGEVLRVTSYESKPSGKCEGFLPETAPLAFDEKGKVAFKEESNGQMSLF